MAVRCLFNPARVKSGRAIFICADYMTLEETFAEYMDELWMNIW